uniref:Family with sequence similarity 81 member A n=2 Tax=Erpetoichthys calabaricus TaxID=27687 RepID=A0A8C4TJH7_ERPCA
MPGILAQILLPGQRRHLLRSRARHAKLSPPPPAIRADGILAEEMSKQGPHFPLLAPWERNANSVLKSHLLQAKEMPPDASVNRADQLEDRLWIHEKKAATLAEQAFRMKEEIADSLRDMQSKGAAEQVARQVLEEHIRKITAIVRQLNRDIVVLQEQIIARDNVNLGNNAVVKNLEMQHISSLGDLRGRIARCDASIARLSADLKSTYEGIQNLSNEQKSNKEILETRIKDTENQFISRIEFCMAQHDAKMKMTQESGTHQLQLFDSKVKKTADDLKAQIDVLQMWVEKEQKRTVMEFLQKTEQMSSFLKNRMESSEKALEDKYNKLSMKLQKMNDTQKMNSGSQSAKQTEEKLNTRIGKIEKRLWDEMQNMREETNSGFTAIHESLCSLRQIMETKVKIETTQLQKQIRQVKMMAQPIWRDSQG